MSQVKTWDLLNENGSTLLEFNSFIDCNFKAEAKTVEQPVEQGSFASYNKVLSSRPAQVTLSLEGEDSVLQAALEQLEELRIEASKCQVVTPYGLSPLGTLTNYDYSYKSELGLGRILVALTIQEIREVSTQFSTSTSISPSQAKRPSDASVANNGKQQGQDTNGKPYESTLNKWLS